MRAERADQDRAGYLREICELLWPDPASATLNARSPDARPDLSLIVLPGLRRPRLLVPAERRPAAAAVRRYGEPGSARNAIATRALSVALASGLGKLFLRDRVAISVPSGAETIETRLSSLVGQRVAISVHLGAARANRKPVLQMLTTAGETAGFAKVGINSLTADLVSSERRALRLLHQASLRELQAPRVLGHDRWNGLEILVLSPLPVWEKRTPLPPGRLDRAMAEVAGVGARQESALAASEYLALLLARLDGAGDDAEQATLRSLLAELTSRTGDIRLSFGAWHGDWTPWNMACTGSGLLVWDWERFTAPAPLGFDALHYWLQTEVVGHRRDPAQSAAACQDRAPALLAPFGVPAPQARVSALLYLADLSVRYLTDRQEQAGAALGAPRRWLLPALAAGLPQRPAGEGG